MSSQLEAILSFGVIGFVVLLTFGFSFLNNKLSSAKIIMYSIGGSFVLFIVASIWWGIFASDGLSQVVGWTLYGVSFVLTNLLVIGGLYVVKKRTNTL
ncbi:hypothetical protein [Alkalihalobacterium elongatum]|uniref:hypothetical protein n=1 Tax=Alkalihalobacterium elongatum TaxID=2675466 RepID=UPI001C1F3639|nr:hypothetical protein [Alkalihalobacterium elongatum]